MRPQERLQNKMGFWNNKVIFLFLILLLEGASSSRNKGDECTMIPSGTVGICTEIHNCLSNDGQIDSADDIKLCTSSNFGNIIICCRTTPEVFVRKMCTKWRKMRDCSHHQTLVRGGVEARSGEFPHMVSILEKSKDDQVTHICGGSLINEMYVLTAAHCLQNAATELYVRVGGHDHSIKVEKGRKDISVVKWIIHPDFNSPQRYNDIALLQLQQKVAINNNVRPACLPQGKNYRIAAGSELVVAGWGGYGDGNDKSTSNVLHKATVKATDRFVCDNSLKSLLKQSNLQDYPAGITDSIICGIETITGTCKGDSGGAVMLPYSDGYCDYEVVGLVSRGAPECKSNEIPGLYTRIDYFLDWIVEKAWPKELPTKK